MHSFLAVHAFLPGGRESQGKLSLFSGLQTHSLSSSTAGLHEMGLAAQCSYLLLVALILAAEKTDKKRGREFSFKQFSRIRPQGRLPVSFGNPIYVTQSTTSSLRSLNGPAKALPGLS